MKGTYKPIDKVSGTNMKKPIHKIGEHGAVGWETQQGRICAECNEPIKEVSNTGWEATYAIKNGKCTLCGQEVKGSLTAPTKTSDWHEDFWEKWVDTHEEIVRADTKQLEDWIENLLSSAKEEYKRNLMMKVCKWMLDNKTNEIDAVDLENIALELLSKE
jgi:transcription elongation factor Elf1